MHTPERAQRRAKPRRKTAPAQSGDEQKPARKPSYVRAKLAVSQPGDPEEREADAVAQEASQARSEAGPREDERMISAKPVPTAQRLLRRKAAKGPARKSVSNRAAKGAADEVKRKEEEQTQAPGAKAAARLQRAADAAADAGNTEAAAAETAEAATETAEAAGESLANEPEESLEQRLERSRGVGRPLDPEARRELEEKLGQDFSSVVIHADAEAAELCQQIQARAFTVGNDIYFAPGEYAPSTENGKNLLAHELTHVVQQSDGVQRKLMRAVNPADNGQPHAGDPTAAAAYRELITVPIPTPKGQHATMYGAWATAGRLTRPAGRRVVRNTAQIANWMSAINVNETKVRQKLQEVNVDAPTDPNARLALTINGRERIERTIPDLTELVKIPTWDRQGGPRRFQVDHMVEYQVASTDPAVDTIANYELFDPFLNRSSGGGLMIAIRRNVQNYLATVAPYKTRTSNPKASWDDAGAWLAGHAITFDFVRANGTERNVAVGGWSVADIEAIAPLTRAREAPNPAKGNTTTLVLASSVGGFQIARLSHRAAQSSFNVPAAHAGAIAGLSLQQISLNGSEGSAAAGTAVGSLQARYALPERWQPANPDLTLSLKSAGEYIAAPDQLPPLDLDFRGLSPVHFDAVRFEGGKLVASGQLTPSLPILRTPITVELNGDDLTFGITYSSGELNLPIPGVSVDDAAVSLFFSTARGFGASGSVFFSVRNLGSGSLTVSATTGEGFSASGGFDFDSKLFDRARIEVWYRNGQFGGEGTIGIDNPDKIKGIRSASVTARYDAGAFSATGTVQPSIPGVQQAGLTIAYAEAAGLTIGGNLQLAPNAALRSGSIDVTVNKRGEDWKVAASGTAQPAIPGVDSQLTVSYDDGAFTAELSGSYRRGMMSGSVTVGATNRSVGEDGRPTGDPLPNGEVVVYGQGSATIQIAPWLQGTAGIRFDPNGEVTVSGEIGIPNDVEIFARREIQRSLLDIAVQIPIVPGIVAEIGGGLTAVAGIGPGMIDQLRIGITYNPAHEDQTHVTGDAHLRVPADAGLRLAVRAGIGLGIPGASVTGGLEIGGTLGIEGAAEAGVHIDWTPATGLDLTANLSVHAQPSFTFDISGYVSVRALGFSVYSNRWQLASFSFGSDYRFGISLPVHYHEGEPFDVSLDDVEFEVPDIDPGSVLDGLIERIA